MKIYPMRRLYFSLLLLPLFALCATAQSAPAPTMPATQVKLGESVVALTGPWKFQVGDNPKWADPDFDDSAWETVDLGAKAESIDPEMGTGGFSPGWTAKGHPGYAGFAWYRMRIRITGADGPLALLAPPDVDDSYQLFTNGALVGSFGNFNRRVPAIYYTLPRMFALPERAIQSRPDGTAVVAFRFYMAPRTLLQPQSGGMHSPPIIGLANAVSAAYHVAWERIYRLNSSALLGGLVFLAFAFLILMLYVFDRTEKILFWPLAACGLNAMIYAIIFIASTTQLVTNLQESVLVGVAAPISVGLWLMTWWAFFGLQDKKWIRNTIVALVLGVSATYLLFQILLLRGSAPHSVFVANTVSNYAWSAASLLLLALIAWFGWRRPQRESWVLFLALLFYAIPNFSPALRLLHIPTWWFPFGIRVILWQVTDFAMLVCLSLVLLRRFRSSQRRQQAIELDLKQAQQVQQVLMPQRLSAVPGFRIESEFRPARQVGGDFFQIVPGEGKDAGSVLVVVGDVAGKGAQAGMLVALLVGAIRTCVQAGWGPTEMLNALNQRLCGREHALATCVVLHIDGDGRVQYANAGHLPPYVNGKELAIQGALPLGAVPDADFSTGGFTLEPGDTLVLMSDGIAEAQDSHGHLFGFDRIHTMLQKPVTAADVATAAQTFGQQDDILVLRIVRDGKEAGVPNAEPALAMG